MNDFLKYVGEIQSYITYNSFYSIPLDILAHLVIGVLLTVILHCFRVRFRAITLIVLLLAIGKEIIDHQLRGNAESLESIKDILISILYPCYRLAQDSIRKRKALKHQEPERP